MSVNSFCFDAAPGKAFSLSRSKARQIESKSCSFHISYLILAHLLILKWRLQKIYVMLIHLDTVFSHWTIEVPICHWDFSYQMHLVDLSYYRAPPPPFVYLSRAFNIKHVNWRSCPEFPFSFSGLDLSPPSQNILQRSPHCQQKIYENWKFNEF